MSKVWVVNIRTESGDEYCRVWQKKPNHKKIANKLFKWLGYGDAKELEKHFDDNVHSVEIENYEVY